MVSEHKQFSELVIKADEIFKQLITAHRSDKSSAYNRVHKRMTKILDEIENHGETGQRAMEAWLESDKPLIRFLAARRALAWNSSVAVPVLGRLLVEPLPAPLTEFERFSIRSRASRSLYRYFNIRNFDNNSLIEPLKAYGIDLPRRPEQIWLD